MSSRLSVCSWGLDKRMGFKLSLDNLTQKKITLTLFYKLKSLSLCFPISWFGAVDTKTNGKLCLKSPFQVNICTSYFLDEQYLGLY